MCMMESLVNCNPEGTLRVVCVCVCLDWGHGKCAERQATARQETGSSSGGEEKEPPQAKSNIQSSANKQRGEILCASIATKDQELPQ